MSSGAGGAQSPVERRRAFELLPAIDLREGTIVRLTQGDFARQTVYSDDPVAVAIALADAGATWLHVVDLDGARAGEPRQAPVIARIVAVTSPRVRSEVAGGLRTEAAVEAMLAVGAARVVVGTAALRDPTFAARLVRRHGPDRIVVALDVRDGLAVGEAWRAGAAGVPVASAVERLADAGVDRFEVTSIDRDGSLAGPDLGLVGALAGLGRGAVIASGGVRSVEDVLAARDAGAAGAIVGKALYEGRLDLRRTLAALAEREGRGQGGGRGDREDPA